MTIMFKSAYPVTILHTRVLFGPSVPISRNNINVQEDSVKVNKSCRPINMLALLWRSWHDGFEGWRRGRDWTVAEWICQPVGLKWKSAVLIHARNIFLTSSCQVTNSESIPLVLWHCERSIVIMEKVQLSLERFLPELRDLKRKNLFNTVRSVLRSHCNGHWLWMTGGAQRDCYKEESVRSRVIVQDVESNSIYFIHKLWKGAGAVEGAEG